MPSTVKGVVNGAKYMLMIEGKYAMLVTGVNFTVNHSTRDITVRETNNWSTSVRGMREWSVELDALLGFTYEDGGLTSRHQINTTTFGLYSIPPREITWVLQEGYRLQNKMFIALIDWENNAISWEGEAYLNGVSIDTPNEASSTVNLAFTGVGETRMTTVSGLV